MELNKILAFFFDKFKVSSPLLYTVIICLLIAGQGVLQYLQAESIIDGKSWEALYSAFSFLLASVLGTRTTSYLK